MTQTGLIKKIAHTTGIDTKTVAYILETATTEIAEVLKRGDTVAIYHFGTFMPKLRAAKRARNIIAGTFIDIPPRRVPYFKASRELLDSVISSTQA